MKCFFKESYCAGADPGFFKWAWEGTRGGLCLELAESVWHVPKMFQIENGGPFLEAPGNYRAR